MAKSPMSRMHDLYTQLVHCSLLLLVELGEINGFSNVYTPNFG